MTSFTLTPLNQLLSEPYKFNWLIKDHMEKHSIAMLFGEPASAKSFIAMDIAFCVAAGIDWNGNTTEQGKVVYIAGEGHSGIAKRFKALGMKYSMTTNDIFLSTLPTSLMDSASVDVVQKWIDDLCPNPALIIIDTLQRNFGNGDENSARDFGIFLFLITKTLMASGATVMLIHHSGHGSSERGRGSSAIRAAMDVEYKVTKDKDLVTMTCSKAKEFRKPEPISFNLNTQSIPDWLDEEGKPVESAILESTSYVAPARTSSISQNDTLVFQALIDSLADKGTLAPAKAVAKYPELAGNKYIHVSDWRSTTYLLLDQNSGGKNKPQANQKAFSRALGKLLHANKIVTEDDHYWLAA